MLLSTQPVSHGIESYGNERTIQEEMNHTETQRRLKKMSVIHSHCLVGAVGPLSPDLHNPGTWGEVLKLQDEKLSSFANHTLASLFESKSAVLSITYL